MTVVTDAFANLGREVAVALGAPELATAIVQHPLGGLDREAAAGRGRSVLMQLLEAIDAPPQPAASGAFEDVPRTVVAGGSWDAINSHFYSAGWTDGLPIVPPVEEKVAALCREAAVAGEDIIGTIPPRMGVATAEKIAANAVMAGCGPEHFAVVLAAVKAMCAPEFNLLPMQATTNPVTPLVIVNGPMVQRLRVNSGYNVFGPGSRSNAVIGRAVRFVLLNIGGATPGKLDHACHGQPGKYSFCIAEDEAANPWEPLHVERGFRREDSTVTVIGVAGTQDIIHYARTDAQQLLATLVNAIPREGLKNLYSGGEPLLVLGPEQAAILAAAGLTKKDVKRAFFEGTQVPLALLNPDTVALVKGRRAKWFESGTPEAVPLADSVDHVQIVVAGGAGNHTTFLPTWGDTKAVTIRID